MDSVTQVGVGGIFALMVLKEVFAFVKTRKTNGQPSSTAVLGGIVAQQEKLGAVLDKLLTKAEKSERAHFSLSQQTGDLHDWHKPDADGTQSWKGDRHRHERLETQLGRIEGIIRQVAGRCEKR